MEFKQDDSCSVQKSSCFLEIPFFKLSLTKGTLYKKAYVTIFLFLLLDMLKNFVIYCDNTTKPTIVIYCVVTCLAFNSNSV